MQEDKDRRTPVTGKAQDVDRLLLRREWFA